MVLTVREVMTPHTINIDYAQSVKNAARKMAQFGISSLLVVGKEGLRGIITEKDIVNRVVCLGLDPSVVPVCDVMSEPVIVVSPDEPLEKAVELMLVQRIKKLPVMEEENEKYHLVGLLSLLDVARVHPDLVQGLKFMIEQLDELEPDFYVS